MQVSNLLELGSKGIREAKARLLQVHVVRRVGRVRCVRVWIVVSRVHQEGFEGLVGRVGPVGRKLARMVCLDGKINLRSKILHVGD